MSEPIIATAYTDPRLDTIRAQVALKDDTIPYLLLPVKIETRFMKVERPLFNPDVFADLMLDLAKLDNYMDFDPVLMPAHEILGRFSKIADGFQAAETKAGSLKKLDGASKQAIVALLNSLSKQNQVLGSALNKIGSLDLNTLLELRAFKNRTDTSMVTMLAVIARLTPELPAGDAFLLPLQNIVKALNAIATAILSTDARKEKRQLFIFLDEQFAVLEFNIKEQRVIIASNITATSEQLKQLDALTAQLLPLCTKTAANIKTLKSEFKSIEYSAIFEALTKKLTLLQQDISTRFKPRLQIMHEIPKVNVRDILLSVNELRVFLKKINAKPFAAYDEIISSRKKLYSKAEGIFTDLGKVIKGDEYEVTTIKKSWNLTDAELNKFAKRISAFKTADTVQQTELDKTVNYINNSLRKGFANLKSGSKTSINRLNNSVLDKALTTYSKAIEKINELSQKTSSQEVNEQDVTPEVETFHKTFLHTAQNLVFLPQQYYQTLFDAAKTLEENINLLKETTGFRDAGIQKTYETNAHTQIREIAEASLKANTATASRSAMPVSEVQSSLVFAAATITRDELWVRIYPDDIAVHTHETALTEAELSIGKAYWLEIAAAGDDPDLKLAAWRAIIASYDSQRAAWIVRTTKPADTKSFIQNVLQKTSGTTIEINKELDRLHAILSKPMQRNMMFEVLGQTYPILNNIQEKLKTVKNDNVTLLLKMQHRLFKIQHQLRKFAGEAEQMTEAVKIQASQGLSLMVSSFNIFDQITRTFKSIGKVSSEEMVRNVAVNAAFGDVPVKESSWTSLPHSRVMPGQFVVLTMRNGNYRHAQVTNVIPENLVVGVHPSMVEGGSFQYDEDHNLIVDDSIKWLSDFNDAVAKGMALSITLDAEDVEKGFDKVLVIGIKDTTPDAAKKLLEDLIDNHHFNPEGASFLPIGTATNNTDKASSGYRRIEEDASLSFSVERNSELPVTFVPDPNFPTDSERLAEGLGIDVSFFNNLENCKRTEISDALIFNKGLFHGTIGDYMEEGLDSLFTKDNIQHTKAFFNNYVSGRGILPAIRVGVQPYGILPVTAFSRFSATANDAALPQLTKEDFNNPAAIKDALQTRFNIRLKQLLSLLDSHWTAIRNSKVLYSGNTNPANPQAHFMGMLGLNAVSQELFYRYGVNVASRQGTDVLDINFSATDIFGPIYTGGTLGTQVSSGYYYKSDYFIDEQIPFTDPLLLLNSRWNRINTQFNKAMVFTMRHLKNQSQILGDKIDNTELSDTLTTPANPNAGTPQEQFEARQQIHFYIDWLLDQNPWDVHAQNKFSTVTETGLTAGMPSKSLLFLLLRHAVLSAYADTILKILEFEGLTNQETIKKMGSPGFYYQRYAANFRYVTKWTFLFSKIGSLDGVLDFKMDTTNSFYVYMNSLAGSSAGFLNNYVSPENTSVFTNYANHAAHQPFIDELNDTKSAIRKFKEIPTQRLEKLLREHLDLCTYRLDAWRLGQVNKRLKENRQANKTGIHLGAYGWVENLRKGGERLPAVNIPPELWKTGDEPVFTDADNLGFIHTPSLNHAVTAAIMRAGFHANIATDEVDNLLAVNLSSERIRTALNLISGIRSGQDTAAMLGYQFERGLHERYLHIPLELDEYIYDFRDEFPLSIPVDENVALADVSLTQVVNGLELLETAQAFIESKGGPPHPGDSLYQSLKAFEADWWTSVNNANINTASAPEKDAMLKEIDRMADAFDALGDLCLSESIYQVTKGNYVRSSAIMDKLAKGDVPFDIEFADTPRTGTVVTHKVAMFINLVEGIDRVLAGTTTPLAGTELATAVTAAGATAPQWASAFTPRALAEPALNKWAGNLIGNPAKIKCLVTYTIPDVVTTPVAITVTLANLSIQPLDVLHLFGTGPLDGGAELNARVATYIKKTVVLPAGFTGTADALLMTIKYTERAGNWAADDYSFYEKTGLIQSIRELITNSAALAADDLLIPGQEEVPEAQIKNFQPDELLIRITNLKARMQIVFTAFNHFFTTEISADNAPGHTFTNQQIDSLRLLLNDASVFGIPGTVPDLVKSYGNNAGIALLNAADGAAKAMSVRLAQANSDIVTGSTTTLSPEVRVNALAEAAKKILGRAFIAVPHFKLRNLADLTAQNNLPKEKGLLRSAPVFAMDEWSQSVARVRQRLSVLETMEMWSANFGGTSILKKPFQFPFALNTDGTSHDHWLGIEFPAGYLPEEDKLSLIVMNAEAALTGAAGINKIGLLLDEWAEIIPNPVEMTGIAFNYDQPDAKAPNTLLLAVTPKQTGKWSWDDLAETLNDTLEMAKNRAVEPEQLEDTVFGQILPGLLTEVVPPQLRPDDTDQQSNTLGLQVVTDFSVVNDTYQPEEL
ncbi:hypothetical protein [Dyadobacter sp. NIV53]|uniref:hypothetical protein n=1 Tax=Dyadobacter sp. NIV53 TaxID=2861765 RepID=UPI001C8715EF|nr:hypothetical protein [Dyadobacter sp. NIV53]